MGFINEALLFLGITLSLLVALILYAFTRNNYNWEETLANFKKAEGHDKVLMASIKILTVPVLVAIVFFGANKAFSQEVKWLPYSKVFVGLDYNIAEKSPMCLDVGTSNRVHSNIGFQQYIAIYGNISFSSKFTHNSCALNKDAPGINAVGLSFEWIIK